MREQRARRATSREKMPWIQWRRGLVAEIWGWKEDDKNMEGWPMKCKRKRRRWAGAKAFFPQWLSRSFGGWGIACQLPASTCALGLASLSLVASNKVLYGGGGRRGRGPDRGEQAANLCFAPLSPTFVFFWANCGFTNLSWLLSRMNPRGPFL